MINKKFFLKIFVALVFGVYALGAPFLAIGAFYRWCKLPSEIDFGMLTAICFFYSSLIGYFFATLALKYKRGFVRWGICIFPALAAGVLVSGLFLYGNYACYGTLLHRDILSLFSSRMMFGAFWGLVPAFFLKVMIDLEIKIKDIKDSKMAGKLFLGICGGFLVFGPLGFIIAIIVISFILGVLFGKKENKENEEIKKF